MDAKHYVVTLRSGRSERYYVAASRAGNPLSLNTICETASEDAANRIAHALNARGAFHTGEAGAPALEHRAISGGRAAA